VSRIWDISPVVSPSLEGWPGDTRFAATRTWSQAHGDSCTVSRVTLSTHLGAHADAPLHYLPDGADAAAMAIEPFLGPARVIQCAGIEVLDRERVQTAAGASRVLFRVLPEGAGEEFPARFAALSADGAQALVEMGVRLFGTDAPSVDPVDSKTLDVHRLLHGGNVAILEGLVLAGVPAGEYELVALPLRWRGVDATPVRAVLRA
jgi:arylformamidase